MEAQIFQMRMVNLKMVLLMARKEVPQVCFFVPVHAKQGLMLCVHTAEMSIISTVSKFTDLVGSI